MKENGGPTPQGSPQEIQLTEMEIARWNMIASMEDLSQVTVDNPELPAIRTMLDAVASRGADALSIIRGLTIVEHENNRPEGEDCMQYVFGPDNVEEMANYVFGVWKQVPEVTSGTIVFYIKDEYAVHVGVGTKYGTVISKWGKGPVVEHPVYFVPSSYGSHVLILSDTEHEQ